MDQQSRTITDLEEALDRQRAELEAVKMGMELERLRQLEEVRRQLEEVGCQSDKEQAVSNGEQMEHDLTLDEASREGPISRRSGDLGSWQ